MKKRRTATPREALTKAAQGRYAIGAFNASDLLTLNAIANAATKLRSPVIVETSPGETEYFGKENEVALLKIAERRAKVSFFSNLDHATSMRDVFAALRAGYQMLHFDGSLLPLAVNIRQLQKIVPQAHKAGCLVEGERDHITGAGSERHRGRMEREQEEGQYTDPDAARAFVQATGIDILASFLGNVHGVFDNKERLDIELLRTIRKAVPCFLSLHGGSGIQDADVRAAVRAGITKVNVNTELRIAYIAALRSVLARNKNEIAPYKLFPPVIAAIQRVVEKKIKLFGSAGKA